MGLGATKNLVHAGFHVVAYDRNLPKIEQATQLGASRIEKLSDVDHTIDAVLLFVTTGEQAFEILSGSEPLYKKVRPATLILLGTTTSPEVAKKIAQTCVSQNLQFVECPVSGGAIGAESGTLTVIAGGSTIAIERATPILNSISRNLKFVGERIGDASLMKMTNQLLVAVNLAGAAEVMAFATATGLNKSQVFEILSLCAGNSWIWQDRMRRFVNLDRTVKSKVSTLAKDLNIAKKEIGNEASKLTLFNIAHEFVSEAASSGFSEKDDTSLVEFAEHKWTEK